MKLLKYYRAPAHPIRICAGVFAFCAVLAACEDGIRLADRGPRSVEVTGDTVQLASGVSLHDVKIRAVQGSDFDPATVTAKIGDVVRFTVADTRTHALSIQPPTEEARAAMSEAGQLRSPPLVAQGTAWVVSLAKMPAGAYTVSCVSHAGTATIHIQ